MRSRFVVTCFFFVFGYLGTCGIGLAIWPDAPGTFIFGCLSGVAALSAVVYGISR